MQSAFGFMKSTLVKVRDVLRHGLLGQTMLDILRRLGIEITPYYLVEESADTLPAEIPPAKLPELEMRFFTLDDAPAIAAMPDGELSETEARARLEGGVWGFGAWSAGELVSFTWANLEELDFDPCRRPLESNEAYLYGAKTSRSCRGMNLGPAMRVELYRSLAQHGRMRLLSISYTFNRPAIRFKQKLNARFAFHYLYLNLWGLWRRNWLVRRDPNV